MQKVLNFAAVAEAATGMALLTVPSLVGQLLLGQELTGVAVPVARVGGVRYWMDSPDTGPHGFGGRLGMTFLFPAR
jgi:hypothetical protein